MNILSRPGIASAVTSARPITTSIVGGLGVFLTRHEAGSRLPRHDHAHASLNVILQGGCGEQVGRLGIDAMPGTLVVTPAGAHHSNRFLPIATVSLLVQVPPETLAGMGPVARTFGEVRALRSPELLARAQFVAARVRRAAASVEVADAIWELISAASPAPPARQRIPAAWLARVRDQLADAPASAVILERLARDAGVAPSTLSNAFRRTYGCTPGEFLRRQRIARAMQALTGTSIGLSELAARMGFSDQAHFTRVFKRETGLAPGQFRALRAG